MRPSRHRSAIEEAPFTAGTPSSEASLPEPLRHAWATLRRGWATLRRSRRARPSSRRTRGGHRAHRGRASRALHSVATEGLAPDEILYRDEALVVMPSWLEIDGRESYAVRSIVRLSLGESAPPRRAARVVCALALALATVSLVHYLRATLPPGVAWAALAASLALALVASHVAFVRPSRYTLDVTLADGASIRLVRPTRAALLALHRALTRAMERQRGG